MNEGRKNYSRQSAQRNGLKNKLAPSILAADFTRLGQEVSDAVAAGADMIHIDVMDGCFVPSISFGTPVVRAVSKATDRPLDVHLMIVEPEKHVADFIKSGADGITFHIEATKQPKQLIEQIHALGAKASVALDPNTPISEVDSLLKLVDMVLIMTVEPGYGGQEYIEACTEKIVQLRRRMEELGITAGIQVDGGITPENVQVVLEAGANIIVAGTSVFEGNIEENVRSFQRHF